MVLTTAAATSSYSSLFRPLVHQSFLSVLAVRPYHPDDCIELYSEVLHMRFDPQVHEREGLQATHKLMSVWSFLTQTRPYPPTDLLKVNAPPN